MLTFAKKVHIDKYWVGGIYIELFQVLVQVGLFGFFANLLHLFWGVLLLGILVG
jgi:hypothetical protein